MNEYSNSSEKINHQKINMGIKNKKPYNTLHLLSFFKCIMNAQWQQFLSTQHATTSPNDCMSPTEVTSLLPKALMCPLSHLAILKASGPDATTFLQGQCTCNLNEIKLGHSKFGAFCSNTGRVLTTFIIINANSDWLIILPATLLPSIQQRLQKYILRSQVKLIDCSNDLLILGLRAESAEDYPFTIPTIHLTTENEAGILLCLTLDKDKPRFLYLTPAEEVTKAWESLCLKGFMPLNTELWELLDIQEGLPWLNTSTTEEFIPQMLNLDKLEGISFNKGCYTGQEIVARTHYLGKAKRALFTAVIKNTQLEPPANSFIIDQNTSQLIGQLLSSITFNNECTLQAVLAVDSLPQANLTLQNFPDLRLTLQ